MSLSPGFTVTPYALIDVPLGVTHKTRSEGAVILGYLENGIAYAALGQRSQGLGVSSDELASLLGFLNIIGALRRRNSVLRTFLGIVQRLITFVRTRVRFPALVQRQPLTIRTLTYAVVQASIGITVITGVVSALFAIGLAAPLDTVLITAGGSLIILLLSTVLHEYAHYVFIARETIPAVVIRRGMRVGLLHRTAGLPAIIELQSAFAGPIAGASICFITITVSQAYDLGWLTAASLCIACIHLGSLLPWYGDGKSIMRIITQRNHHETRSDI